MKQRTRTYLLFFCVLGYRNASATSIVYNFRIAHITKQPILDSTGERNHTLVALFFDQFKERHNGTFQNYKGGFGSLLYNSKPYYFRTDFAVANIAERREGIRTFSGTLPDDILFTAGRNFIINKHADVTLSGLFGVPTHNIFRLQHPDFGYSQIGTGIQLDGLYKLNSGNACMYGARYIYFVPRHARDDKGKKHLFSIGHIGDILLAYEHNWNKSGIEMGYTGRWRFGALVHPPFDQIVRRTNQVRSNFYVVYKYRFLLENVAHRFLFNVSYGFDHKPKIFGNKYIITLWASWNISF